MISSRYITWRAAAVLTAALVWPAAASAQDDAFRRGLDARGDREWKAVVMHMRTAISADPKESTRKVGAGFLRPFGGGMEYLPHFFLGEALFQLQDCVGAVEAWWISQQQTAVRVRREFAAAISDGYAKCASRGVLPPPEFNSQQGSTRQAIAEAMAYAERVSKLGQEYIDAWAPEIDEQYRRATGELQAAQARLAAGARARSAADFTEGRAAAGRASGMLTKVEAMLKTSIENVTFVRRQVREVDALITGADNGDRAIDSVKIELTPALAAARQSGRDLLARARERVRAGEKAQSATTVNEALGAAQDAAAAFKDVLDQATKLARVGFERDLREVVAAATDALSFLDASFATLERLAGTRPEAAAPDIATRREALQKRVATIRRRVETANKTENIGGLRDAVRLAGEARGELDTLIASFGPVTLRDRGVHAALEEGARLYLTGEYQQALSALDPTALIDAPLQLHVHLFRAAALYHLFVRSGEKDDASRTQALAEIDACRRLAPGFQPDPQAFGPRFIAFFQNAGTTVTP
jgi:hypothetical protein